MGIDVGFQFIGAMASGVIAAIIGGLGLSKKAGKISIAVIALGLIGALAALPLTQGM